MANAPDFSFDESSFVTHTDETGEHKDFGARWTAHPQAAEWDLFHSDGSIVTGNPDEPNRPLGDGLKATSGRRRSQREHGLACPSFLRLRCHYCLHQTILLGRWRLPPQARTAAAVVG